jgi:hypothetical protein
MPIQYQGVSNGLPEAIISPQGYLAAEHPLRDEAWEDNLRDIDRSGCHCRDHILERCSTGWCWRWRVTVQVM